jgi:hypothetical protein
MSNTQHTENNTRPRPFEATRGDAVRLERPYEDYEMLFESETHRLVRNTMSGFIYLFERAPSVYPDRFLSKWNGDEITVNRPLRDVDGTFYQTKRVARNTLEGNDSSLSRIVGVERITDDSMFVELLGLNHGDDPAVIVLE